MNWLRYTGSYSNTPVAIKPSKAFFALFFLSAHLFKKRASVKLSTQIFHVSNVRENVKIPVEMAQFQKSITESDDFWADDSIPESTPMRDFYRGKVILLTGGTGFLGQIYVEKLLR